MVNVRYVKLTQEENTKPKMYRNSLQ